MIRSATSLRTVVELAVRLRACPGCFLTVRARKAPAGFAAGPSTPQPNRVRFPEHRP